MSIPKIKVTKDNWKQYHGMECKFGDIPNEPDQVAVLVGYTCGRFIAETNGLSEWTDCEINDPLYVALSKHEGKCMALGIWSYSWFVPDEVWEDGLWGKDERGVRVGVSRKDIHDLLPWRG